MKKYRVWYTQTVSCYMDIEAENESGAVNKADEALENGEDFDGEGMFSPSDAAFSCVDEL